MTLKLISFILLLLINCNLVMNNLCSICDVIRKFTCITSNSYQFCKTDKYWKLIPNPELGTHICPNGTFCDSTNLNRCVSVGTPSCIDTCGVCNAYTNIACINKRNFTNCHMNKPASTYGYPCPGNLVCYSASFDVCVDPARGSTCSSIVEIPTDPKIFCTTQTNLVLPGRYGIKGDCKKYNYCYKYQGNRTGIQLECPGTTYFNCESHQCEATRCTHPC